MALLPARPARAQTPQIVGEDWPLIPSGVNAGQSFRLVFVTSTTTKAESSDIDDYNSFVQAAANNNAALQPFKGKFRALISTSSVDARDNTGTAPSGTSYTMGEGEPFYYLGGAKVADDYDDFYDGSWDDVSGKTESGSAIDTVVVWTGSNSDGTADATHYAGADRVRNGTIQNTQDVEFSQFLNPASFLNNLLALSPVLTVVAGPTNLGASNLSNTTVTLSWDPPDTDLEVTGYQIEVKKLHKDNNEIGKGWEKLAEVGANTTSYRHTGLTSDYSYLYRVRAIYGAGLSGPSNGVAVIPNPEPTGGTTTTPTTTTTPATTTPQPPTPPQPPPPPVPGPVSRPEPETEPEPAECDPSGFDCSDVEELLEREECEALAVLYDKTGGGNWDWMEEGQGETQWFCSLLPGNWAGISLEEGHIRELSLNRRNLSGEIPEFLELLVNLRSLDLSGNEELRGELPRERGEISELDISCSGISEPEWSGQIKRFRYGCRPEFEREREIEPGGCAIASGGGAGNAPVSAVFGLLLIASVLLGVSWRSRLRESPGNFLTTE